jgi:hypothetical protein
LSRMPSVGFGFYGVGFSLVPGENACRACLGRPQRYR